MAPAFLLLLLKRLSLHLCPSSPPPASLSSYRAFLSSPAYSDAAYSLLCQCLSVSTTSTCLFPAVTSSTLWTSNPTSLADPIRNIGSFKAIRDDHLLQILTCLWVLFGTDDGTSDGVPPLSIPHPHLTSLLTSLTTLLNLLHANAHDDADAHDDANVHKLLPRHLLPHHLLSSYVFSAVHSLLPSINSIDNPNSDLLPLLLPLLTAAFTLASHLTSHNPTSPTSLTTLISLTTLLTSSPAALTAALTSSSPPPTSLTSLASSSPTSGEASSYVVILPAGAVVRSSISIDSSPRLHVLPPTTPITILERRLHSGVTRLRIAGGAGYTGGWISERLRGGREELVVEEVVYEMAHHIPSPLPHVPPLNPDTTAPSRHSMHQHPLTLARPSALYPNSPGWACDHCGASNGAGVLAWVCRGGGCNWCICEGCFGCDGDSNAAVGDSNAAVVDSNAAVGDGMEEREGAARERERGEAAANEAERVLRAGVISSLSEMGFPEDVVERMVAVAQEILGVERLTPVRRRVMSMAVEFLTNGERAVEEARRERTLEVRRERNRERVREISRIEREENERRRATAEEEDDGGDIAEDMFSDDEGEAERHIANVMALRASARRQGAMTSAVRAVVSPTRSGPGGGSDPLSPLSARARAMEVRATREVATELERELEREREGVRMQRKVDKVFSVGEADPPSLLRLEPSERRAAAWRLAGRNHMDVTLCEHALVSCGDNLEAAAAWLVEAKGDEKFENYRRGGGGIYEEVMEGLLFNPGVERQKPLVEDEGEEEAFLVDSFQGGEEAVVSDDESESESLSRGSRSPPRSSSSLVASLLSLSPPADAGDGDDADLPASPAAAASTVSASSGGYPPPSEILLSSISSSKVSPLHRTVAAVICTKCQYLEFPGCGTHKMLLSEEKRKGAAKCKRCNCATDTHGPWNSGCRMCRAPTTVDFWNLSNREAQFLLRGFPSEFRSAANKELPVKIKACKCRVCCGVGFPGVGGEHPRLAVCSSTGDFCLSESDAVHLCMEDLQKHMRHLDGCSNVGGVLELVECCATMEEAKYLYSSFPLGETQAKFETRSGDLQQGMIIAKSNKVGVAALDAISLATFERCEDEKGGGREEGVKGGSEARLCVLREDRERGFVLPEFLKNDEAKFVSHVAGVRMRESGAADKIERYVVEVLKSSSILTAREIVLDYMLSQIESEERLRDVFCNHAGDGEGWGKMVEFIELMHSIGGEGERKIKSCLKKWWGAAGRGGGGRGEREAHGVQAKVLFAQQH